MQFYEQKESGPQLGILNDIIAEQAGGWSGPFPDTASQTEGGPGWTRLDQADTPSFFQLVQTISEDASEASSANRERSEITPSPQNSSPNI